VNSQFEQSVRVTLSVYEFIGTLIVSTAQEKFNLEISNNITQNTNSTKKKYYYVIVNLMIVDNKRFS